MIEWLERIGYGAESSRKVVSSRLGFAIRRLENSLYQHRGKKVYFSNQRRIMQRKEQDGLRLLSVLPKIQWDSNLHCPYGYGNPFTFTFNSAFHLNMIPLVRNAYIVFQIAEVIYNCI